MVASLTLTLTLRSLFRVSWNFKSHVDTYAYESLLVSHDRMYRDVLNGPLQIVLILTYVIEASLLCLLAKTAWKKSVPISFYRVLTKSPEIHQIRKHHFLTRVSRQELNASSWNSLWVFIVVDSNRINQLEALQLCFWFSTHAPFWWKNTSFSHFDSRISTEQ